MNQVSHQRSVKQVLLLINGYSRQGRKCRNRVSDYLRNLQIQVIAPEKFSPEHYGELIAEHADNIDAILVGGGDGSISLAIKGALEHRIPLGLVPLGTANNLARNLEIPLEIERACQIVSAGKTQAIDVGVVNGLYFLNVVGIGLSTQVNHFVHPKAKRYFGVLAYMYYALKVAKRVRPFTITLKMKDQTQIFQTLQVSVCNGRFYGSGFVVEKEANIYDGLLDIVCTTPQGWMKAFKVIPALMKGRHESLPEVLSFKVEEFRLETKRPMSLDVDGDIRTKTPADFSVLKKALEVFVP